VDVLDKVVFEDMETLNPPSDPLEACLLGTLDKRVEDMAQLFLPQHHPREILNMEVGSSKEEKKFTLEVELKLLPSHLWYEFLSPN